MRIILALVIIAGACGFFGFHKYSEKRYDALKIKFEKEREQSEELRKSITVLQQKLQLESMKLSELLKKQEDDERNRRLAEERARKEADAKERAEKLALKQKELEDAKRELSNVRSSRNGKLIDVAAVSAKINAAKSKIREREGWLRKINELIGNNKFACFDMCINGTDVRFERKMTRTCRATVSGGMYFCEHYDMVGTDYCTRHLHHHKSWKFPNRYRDDHITPVRYLCRTHKVVWDSETANTYRNTHRNSRAILGNQMQYRREVTALRKEIHYLEGVLRNAAVHNRRVESNNRRNAEAVEQKRNEIESKIAQIEKEIAELNGNSAE
ncbi:MAG: hypothetical protein IJC21_07690 [Lentisphaeria bacterium]|nr:hypothetical protein [Lentisphaeria bacterium]MBR7119082.1 hypothetical protein [Lentisphaeria bacterium]